MVPGINSRYEFKTVKPYVENFIRRHKWKLERTMTEGEIRHEAMVMFFDLVRRLTRRGIKIDNERHLMALFKTAWTRRFTTFTNRDTVQKTEILLSDLNIDVLSETDTSGDDALDLVSARHNENMGFFERLLDEAPQEVKQVLLLLLAAPQEVLQMIFANRNFTNCRLCELLGYDPKTTDLVKAVHKYFD